MNSGATQSLDNRLTNQLLPKLVKMRQLLLMLHKQRTILFEVAKIMLLHQRSTKRRTSITQIIKTRLVVHKIWTTSTQQCRNGPPPVVLHKVLDNSYPSLSKRSYDLPCYTNRWPLLTIPLTPLQKACCYRFWRNTNTGAPEAICTKPVQRT